MSEQHVFQISLTDEKEIRTLISLVAMGMVWAQLQFIRTQSEEEILPITCPVAKAVDRLMEVLPEQQAGALWGVQLTLENPTAITIDDAQSFWEKVYSAYVQHFYMSLNFPEEGYDDIQ